MRKYSLGALYSVRQGPHFQLAKVLAADDDAVHIRLYREAFPERPNASQIVSLTIGKLGEESFGIGHLPLSHQSFASWEPRLVCPGEVAREELEGYELWKKNGGGVWS
jgi:hypothetical protein